MLLNGVVGDPVEILTSSFTAERFGDEMSKVEVADKQNLMKFLYNFTRNE